MGDMASQITSLTIVYSTVYSGADQRKHKRFASLDFVGNSSVTDEFPSQMACNAEMFPYDDVIMCNILDRSHVGLVDAVPVTQYGVTLHVNGLVIWCRYMMGSTFCADYCHTFLFLGTMYFCNDKLYPHPRVSAYKWKVCVCAFGLYSIWYVNKIN